MKKGHVLEMALLHHLQALHELPADIVISPRIVVSLRSGKEIEERIRASKATRSLRDLMSHDDYGD